MQFCSSLMAWLPVFFLYFNQYVGLASVIQLGAVYYFTVCLAEVPSGYFSDRFGRRNTLLISGICFSLSYLFFISATGFAGLAVGQILLAIGIAMKSGTDTAFLYDSLRAAGRESEYAEQEARGQKYGLASLALASLSGGLLGSVDLRLAYVLSLAGALLTIWLCWRLVEPRRGEEEKNTGSLVATITESLGHLRDTVLLWLFAVMILMYCLEHVAFEFYQPYIKLLNFDWLAGDSAPLVSGVIISASMFGGTLGAAYSVRLFRLLGVKNLLFTAFLIQLIIVGGLALLLSGALLALVVFRNFPMAMIHAPVNATIAPRIGSHIRATYLSLQSLGARLLFSSLLFFLSGSVDVAVDLDWANLSTVLRRALLFGIAGTLLVVLFAPRIEATKADS